MRRFTQQPTPVPPQVELPPGFPEIPRDVLDRFPSAADWQQRLDEFWTRTNQAIQQAQSQTAKQLNANVVYTVDSFLIYTNDRPIPMFSLDGTGVRLGDVLVINTPGRKVYIGEGTYQDAQTPFYIDTLGRFSLGANLSWDPDADTLAITGTITATSGSIGGFNIGTDYIRDAANSMGLASAATGGDDVRFWAGDTFANRATAPFRVHESGILSATQISTTSLGIGSGVASAGVLLEVLGTKTASGGVAEALRSAPTLLAAANNDVLYGLRVKPIMTKGAFTGLTVYGLHLGYTSGGGAGTIDNAYALYITPNSIGVNNWGVYVAANIASYFEGVTSFNNGLDATSIGGTTPGSGVFTTLAATGIISTTQAAGTIRNGGDTSLMTLIGGTGSAARLQLYGGTHGALPKYSVLDADTQLFRTQAGTQIAQLDTNGLTISSGKYIQLGNAAVAETPTATHTLTMKDSGGTTYRFLCLV